MAMTHVLIIEDEPLIAMLIKDTLQDAGTTSFDLATTEDEAVALATAHPPAFITSDVNLKVGTGPAAVARIRYVLHADVPTVVISGNLDDAEPCAPPCPQLSKPFAPERLQAHYRQMALLCRAVLCGCSANTLNLRR